MTTEIEKIFFDTFGIEPEIFTGCRLEKDNWKEDTCPFEKDGIMELCHKVCKYAFTEREIYPQITDRILLELICIATSSEITVEFKGIKNVEHLKEVVLNYCIERYGYCLHKDNFKHQVRTLFEEG